ncbi:mannitol-1-phosphate dehydrogenase M1PDH1 [Macrolepiota fuliginosa MF-IS2]|uniref:alcohol dehydrogenase n=1 Tax=Macrolepiota fuliginosa MF-IS2 TaxID=1400762 RepID=A0A9P5X3H2_9AGAR|nr:mannitol-1-phosphate dehydrogenase M1PDH1 [Macrolepiota fuliginosa MF-IS2]
MSTTASPKFTIPKTQRAAVLHTLKSPYTLETNWPVTQPSELKPGQCLVKLEYTGVCHSDLHIRNVDWGREPIIPLVGGHEGVGVVVAIGEGTYGSAVKIGDRVGLKWIADICGTCEMCRTSQDSCMLELPNHGFQMHGTFQEYAVSYANYVTKIPEGVDSASIAPILCAGLTVYKAIKTSGARIGQWVAIPGAGGGLGHLAVQYAVAQGLRVIAIDTGEKKKKLTLNLGAEKWIDFKESKDLVADVQAATGGPGPQVAIVATADQRPFTQAAMYLRNAGTLMVVGMPGGGAMLNSLKVIGSAIGNRQDADEAVAITALGKVKCQYETRKLEDLNTVFQEMEEGKISGRVVLKI